jgi:hypothetical protein
MADYVISESGMSFIANTDDTYYIEKSEAYSNIGKGIKTVEFIRKMNDTRLWFIEAKQCFPDAHDKSKQGECIKAICDKFLHSLNLYCTVKLSVVPDILPTEFTESNILFVLVIKEQDIDRCKTVKRVLQSKLLPYLRIWNTDILVINDDIAKEHRIVC